MSKFYVLDENNNKVEAYDKEGVLAVLAQAIADGSLENIVADAAFINKIRCCVSGTTYNIAFVTQAKYNELVNTGNVLKDTYYYILDDTTCDNIEAKFKKLNETFQTVTNTQAQVRLKSEAIQYIDSISNNGRPNKQQELAYYNGTSKPIDISNIMPISKIDSDIIGMSGSIGIIIDNTKWGSTNYDFEKIDGHCYFSGFRTVDGSLMLINNLVTINNVVYSFECPIDISNKQLRFTYGSKTPKLIKISDNTTVTIYGLYIDYINLAYK